MIPADAGPGALPRLRWGVAGYGDVVRRRAVPALRGLGQQVDCVWGRDGARARATADGFGARRGTDDFAELLAGVEAVYVATPVAAHVPLLLAAVAAGRHVLVEKPLGGALGYDRAGVLAAAGAPVVTAAAYYRRSDPALRAVRGTLRHGPYRVSSWFRGAFAPGPADPMHWRTVAPVAGGGVLADAGSHRIDLLCWLFGPPSAVRGTVQDPFPGGAERRASVELGWADGTTARLRCEWSGRPARDRLALVGAEHSVRLPALDGGLVEERRPRLRRRRSFARHANPLTPVLGDFLAAVAGHGRPGCPLADAMLVDDLIGRVLGAAGAESGGGNGARPDGG
ncbi:Gfo/Idh/MocA family protein [Kitasatospora sp. NPDC006697]|uniref:Gfo/Idh/MocA family protein n=1 Tax=Kitasatospora sp. NPDC006697 TaxID=3364020 RepID=UPI0036BA0AB9